VPAGVEPNDRLRIDKLRRTIRRWERAAPIMSIGAEDSELAGQRLVPVVHRGTRAPWRCPREADAEE
jgi:hypothetical protein